MADIEKRVPVMRHRIQVGVAMATAQTAPLHPPPPPIHTHTNKLFQKRNDISINV